MVLSAANCIAHSSLVQVDEMGKKRVWAIMSDGRKYEGDLLMGADGIRSKVLVLFKCDAVEFRRSCSLMSGLKKRGW